MTGSPSQRPVGWLLRRNLGSGLHGQRDGGLQVFDRYLEVHHICLVAVFLRPGRRLVPLLSLEAVADAATWIWSSNPTSAALSAAPGRRSTRRTVGLLSTVTSKKGADAILGRQLRQEEPGRVE